MSTVDRADMEGFMRGQVESWNAHDRDAFMAWHRRMAPVSLDIEYIGRAQQEDGWFVIEDTWNKHNTQITVEVVAMIVNGQEVAVHHRYHIAGTRSAIEAIETYRFDPGRLYVRYFILPPTNPELDLNQFRGLAEP